MSRRAVFLDRDGTLNEECDYLCAPDRLRVLPGVVDALRRLRGAGFRLVVVTNQSAIARGRLDETGLARIHERLHTLLDHLPDAYLHCPHHPTAGDGPYTRDCDCRKPRDGLVRRAASLLDLRLEGSWVVGDSARDVLLARDLPLRSVLVRCGKPAAEQRAELAAAGYVPDAECDDLAGAVTHLLAAR